MYEKFQLPSIPALADSVNLRPFQSSLKQHHTVVRCVQSINKAHFWGANSTSRTSWDHPAIGWLLYTVLLSCRDCSILTVLQDFQCHGQAYREIIREQRRAGERCSQKTGQGEVSLSSVFWGTCSFLFALYRGKKKQFFLKHSLIKDREVKIPTCISEKSFMLHNKQSSPERNPTEVLQYWASCATQDIKCLCSYMVHSP